jgi:hypothetical protein
MAYPIQSARVAGPVPYTLRGQPMDVPLGPCLIERIDREHADVIWGEDGEHCVAFPIGELVRAKESGTLVLLN